MIHISQYYMYKVSQVVSQNVIFISNYQKQYKIIMLVEIFTQYSAGFVKNKLLPAKRYCYE